MTIAEVLLADFDIEISNTRRTLERVPEGKNDWVPHPKSMPLGKLAMHCATIPLFGHYIIEDPGMDMAAPTRPHASFEFTTAANAVAQLYDAASKCRASLVRASDEHLSELWHFRFGEHTIAHAPRYGIYRGMFFDHMIHHVAQLGVYLRLNDIPVPGLYGPSADEPFPMKK
jgi:hypothetical protein